MNDSTMYVMIALAGLVMWRMDRLGKQIEAVHRSILIELSPTQDQRDEHLTEWKFTRDEAKKDRRNFWIFWVIVGAAAIAWWVVTAQR